VCLRIPLLGVDEVGEFGGVTKEENRSVVEHPVPVAFVCPQFDSKATRIASGIGRARFTTDGGETDSSANLLAHRFEESGISDVAEVVSDLKVTMSASTLGMDLSTEGDKIIRADIA
jgi:hypothetical protein